MLSHGLDKQAILFLTCLSAERLRSWRVAAERLAPVSVVSSAETAGQVGPLDGEVWPQESH